MPQTLAYTQRIWYYLFSPILSPLSSYAQKKLVYFSVNEFTFHDMINSPLSYLATATGALTGWGWGCRSRKLGKRKWFSSTYCAPNSPFSAQK
ncbi:hypothetical protein MICAE_1450001 [Microcystis aeruginosa PCC 9806]|uniref:Uncharacterized protein n=1 Tax=Microcystis aeruginosa PCC 9806 TaxID=1160282 RepID=I4GS28_MICAE|nr:hypothetical protein MICAE_1450001 [Microcystis aeruginosa PCC 9806]